MCPLCLASLAVTIATSTGAAAAVAALAIHVTRPLRKGAASEPQAFEALTTSGAPGAPKGSS